MAAFNCASWIQRMEVREVSLCRRVNAMCRLSVVRGLFAAVSRLGDGVLWYTLMLCLPLIYGVSALVASAHMLVVGVIGLLAYKYLKAHLVRERPYIAVTGIELGGRALDRYSFPSGHTLHAVAFSIIVLTYYPELALLVVPFTALVALSRVVLGLHYPTDVLAGAALGALIAVTSLQFTYP